MSESPLKSFYNEAVAEVAEGVQLRLVMNFRTIDLLEGLLGRGMDELLGELATSTSLMGKFVWAMTREHHPDVSLDQIAGIMFTPNYGVGLGVVVGDLVRRVFNISTEDRDSPSPPKRSGGASRGSTKNGSRQTSGPATSGAKRRAHS